MENLNIDWMTKRYKKWAIFKKGISFVYSICTKGPGVSQPRLPSRDSQQVLFARTNISFSCLLKYINVGLKKDRQKGNVIFNRKSSHFIYSYKGEREKCFI